MTAPRSLLSTLTLASVLVVPLAAVTGACSPDDPNVAETGKVTGGDGDTSGDGDATGDGDPTGGEGDGDGDTNTCVDTLDILLVIDNSGSMGDAQNQLVTGISGLIGPLDAAGVDWRIGITTTDNGNQWCPVGTTTPEGGKLVMSRCTTRIGDFLFGNDVDVQDLACNDLCGDTNFEILATTTDSDDDTKPRPWIQSVDGQTNISAGVSAEQALRCVVPQGVSGCGFESQLESGYLALVRMQNFDEESFGFIHPGSSVLVIVVSDEVDCSPNNEWSEIFSANGNKVFWSDPSALTPTSAPCWNAGVECIGDPSGYTDCVAQDYDVNGAPTNTESDAVLHPVSRYADQLVGLEQSQRQISPNARVKLALLAGFAADGSVVYADSQDPVYQRNFGIGPGCGTEDGLAAVPPVRMREVAEATGGHMASICEANAAPALTQMVQPFIAGCDAS